MKNILSALFGGLLFLAVSMLSYILIGEELEGAQLLAIVHSVCILVGGVFYWRCVKVQNDVTAKRNYQVLALHSSLIFVLYLVASYVLPSEAYVDNFFKNSGFSEVLVKLATILVIVPVSEEIMFRGIVFDSIRLIRPSKLVTLLAAFVSSIVFTVYHHQYEHLSTLVFLFVVGWVLCSARYFSRTLWVPMAVHSFAALCAISL